MLNEAVRTFDRVAPFFDLHPDIGAKTIPAVCVKARWKLHQFGLFHIIRTDAALGA